MLKTVTSDATAAGTESNPALIPRQPNTVGRPAILVAEQEPSQALSVRKLVLETAKFNVLTAHSTREALELFHLFPNISMAVLAAGNGIDCEEVAKAIKSETDKIPIVFLHPQMVASCKYADHQVSSYEPEELLELIRSLLGDPRHQETSKSHLRRAAEASK